LIPLDPACAGVTVDQSFEVPMTKPVSQADEPTLFPREWVIGRAAAGLVRDDEGVLLDQSRVDPLAVSSARSGAVQRPGSPWAQAPQGRPPAARDTAAAPTTAAVPAGATPGSMSAAVPVPGAAAGRPRRSPRPSPAEIEELKLWQARLQRRFEAARMRPRPRYLGDVDRSAASGQELVAEAPARAVRRRPFPWRRLAIALGLAVLASGLYQYRAVLFQL
jgi:hypothetical protein